MLCRRWGYNSMGKPRWTADFGHVVCLRSPAIASNDSPAKRLRAASRRNATSTSTSDMNTSTLAEQERASVPPHARCQRCAGG